MTIRRQEDSSERSKIASASRSRAAAETARPRSGTRAEASLPDSASRDVETTAPWHGDRIRQRFFAEAGPLCIRYRIGPDDVVEHYAAARRGLPGRLVSSTIWIEDLVLAAACSRGVSLAWADLVAHLEAPLHVAVATRLPDAEASATVSRFFDALRRRTAEPTTPVRRGGGPSLREFAGQRSLRSWLVERVFAHASRDRSPHRARPTDSMELGT